MSNEVFGRRLVVIGSEHIGEAEVGAAQVAIEGAEHGVEGLRRAGRSRRRPGGGDVAAEAPAAVGELVHESSTATPRFDESELVEFVAAGLSSFGPRASRSGLGTGRDSAINTRSTARSVPVRSAGERVTVQTYRLLR